YHRIAAQDELRSVAAAGFSAAGEPEILARNSLRSARPHAGAPHRKKAHRKLPSDARKSARRADPGQSSRRRGARVHSGKDSRLRPHQTTAPRRSKSRRGGAVRTIPGRIAGAAQGSRIATVTRYRLWLCRTVRQPWLTRLRFSCRQDATWNSSE